ncbi:MAG: ABC transporter permease [Microthrixaceae bacterium]
MSTAGLRPLARRPVTAAAALLAVAFISVPLVSLVTRAPWSELPGQLTSAAATEAIRLSMLTSFTAAGLACALGLPLAWCLGRLEFPGRALVRALVLLPMVLPPVVGGVALLGAFARSAPIGSWLHDTFGIQLTFSPAGVVLAQTFVALPFFVITVEAALRSMDRRLEEAAATLGARPAQVFTRVTVPTILPSILAGAVLAWARALGEFGATITFAGNIAGRTRTLPLAVYLELESRPEVAVSLSIVLLAVSLLVIVSLRERWLGGR